MTISQGCDAAGPAALAAQVGPFRSAVLAGASRGIPRTFPEVLPGKIAGQGLTSPGLEVPERHSDTEEVMR